MTKRAEQTHEMAWSSPTSTRMKSESESTSASSQAAAEFAISYQTLIVKWLIDGEITSDLSPTRRVTQAGSYVIRRETSR